MPVSAEESVITVTFYRLFRQGPDKIIQTLVWYGYIVVQGKLQGLFSVSNDDG